MGSRAADLLNLCATITRPPCTCLRAHSAHAVIGLSNQAIKARHPRSTLNLRPQVINKYEIFNFLSFSSIWRLSCPFVLRTMSRSMDDPELKGPSVKLSTSSQSIDDPSQENDDVEVRYRSCSWQKTAALLFSEYICLAIMSFPWSFSVLGMVPGVIVTLATAAIVLYTSLVLWRYSLKHPELRDICDVGQKLFGGSRIAYNVTSLFFILNNTFIQALHVLVGAELLNTLSGSSLCTVVFGVITALMAFVVSLPRTLSQLSHIGVFSAATMGLAVLLSIIFAGVQKHPSGYILGQEPIVTIIPIKGTTYVAGMSAFLNIAYTLNGSLPRWKTRRTFRKLFGL